MPIEFFDRARSTIGAMSPTVVAMTAAGGGALFATAVAHNFLRDAWDARFPGYAAAAAGPARRAAAPFTVMFLTAGAQFAFFAVLFAAWALCTRPALRFVFARQSVAYYLACGAALAAVSVLTGFAAPHVNEMYKTLTVATVAAWVLLFSTLSSVGRRDRSYCAPVVVGGVLAALGAAALAAMDSAGAGDPGAYKQLKWASFYALSAIPAALYLALAAGFTTACAVPRLAVDRVFDDNAAALRRSDGLTVKLAFLAATGLVHLLALLIMLPLDWTPYFGGSPNASSAVDRLRADFKCVFFGCGNGNWLYAALFLGVACAGRFAELLVCRYSAPTAALVRQAAQHATAALLFVVPAAWASANSNYRFAGQWWEYALALCISAAATLLFVVWDLSTSSVSAIVDRTTNERTAMMGHADTAPMSDHRNMQYMYA
jgi:hypothetical protein